MGRFKDDWNERHYNRMEELRKAGVPEPEAERLAVEHADSLIEEMYDAADNLRKAHKEGSL